MPSIELNSYVDMPSPLSVEFEKGRITLEKHRMLMLHAGAMGSLRRELIDTLGMEWARRVLTRMGFVSGELDAGMARRLMPNAADDDLLLMGPMMHSAEGIVRVSPLKVDIDIANQKYYAEMLWEDSFEAEVHVESMGLSPEAVCWIQIGYACGYTSAIVGKRILYKEVECAGCGDRHCRIIGKPIEEWEDAAEEARYFEPIRVADQIIQLQEEVQHLRYSIDDQVAMGEMVGTSAAFRDTCELIHKAADSQVTVLLLGETGVGKEVFARSLHSISTRAKNTFVPINCAAIPEELIESELFGVEKGAYTGAQHSRPGRFERAHGGTLFLDEVGELSASAQAKILRVLQDGEFERIGDTRTRRVDVRLVAATNVDLKQAVEAGRFRADLYYRLNIFPVIVPPLRDRKDDIPLLVNRFLEKYSARHGKRVTGITERAMETLMKFDWPGNIRELENMIERGVILVGPNQQIDVKQIFPCVDLSRGMAGTAPGPGGEAPREAAGSLDHMVESALNQSTSLEQIEQIMLTKAVERSNGNLSSAARLLNMTRPQLAYRLKKYQAEPAAVTD
ncbi:MAG: sigma 54-interacting transcriptional regulator [Gammaproteobacteria bacterium]|nr:sigma 54-interacting transcriptional regulator [Gammaproteobacteria bacterium]